MVLEAKLMDSHAEGLAEGQSKALADVFLKMVRAGYSRQEAQKISGLNDETVTELMNKI